MSPEFPKSAKKLLTLGIINNIAGNDSYLGTADAIAVWGYLSSVIIGCKNALVSRAYKSKRHHLRSTILDAVLK